jgi:hypothetical protein
MDPMMLQITPQMQLAQSLIQQGADASPIRSPWQGAARLAQALAGSYIQNKALQGASGMYSQSAAAAAKTVPEGSAIHKALTSPNPLIQAQALQVYNKSLLQFSEPREGGPGTQVMVPGASGPVAANNLPLTKEGQLNNDIKASPDLVTNNTAFQGALKTSEANAQNASDQRYKPLTAALTAQAENQPLVARAGGIAASEAPWQTVETRSGAVIPKAAIPGIGVPAGAPAGPQAPGPQTPPPAPTTLQPAVPSGAPAQAPAPSPANSFGGGVRPLPGGAGIMAPSQDTFKPLIDEDTKELATDREAAVKAQGDQATVAAIRDMIPNVATGWSGPQRLQFVSTLKALGVPDDKLQKFASIDPASGQVAQKQFVALSAAAARQMGAREPGSVISMFAKAYPSLETTPEAINLQTNILGMEAQRRQALASAKTDYLNQSVNDLQGSGTYRGLKGFNEEFNKAHDATDYLRAAEAMSGQKWSPWSRVSDDAHQHQIISLIPSGQKFVGPDGKMYVKK